MLRSFYSLLESASGYSVMQLLGLPTIRRYRALVREYIPQGVEGRVLEIGCGIGTSRMMFAKNYTGIDINRNYIEKARQNFDGTFLVMDAAAMPFPPNTFDDAVCIATAHHLSDEQLGSMLRSATTCASQIHLIDAILPLSQKSRFKNAIFRMDRGRHVRTLDQLRTIVAQNVKIQATHALEGPLHDVCYIRAARGTVVTPLFH